MTRILILTICSVLLVTAPAAAQGPVGNAYGGAGAVPSEVAGATDGQAGEAGTAATPVPAAAREAAAQDLRGDSLPFTGFDILLMLTGAGALLLVGVGMRRFSRRPI